MAGTVIIGAGGAGLAAAYVLESAGVECTVLEKRDFAGGRLYSSERQGHVLDLGAQFFFSRYRTTFELIDRLGMRDEVIRFGSRLALMVDGETYASSMKPAEVIRDPLPNLRLMNAFPLPTRLKLVRLLIDLVRLRGRTDFDDPLQAVDLDCGSFADFVSRKYGADVLEAFAQPVIGCFALASPEEVNVPTGVAFTWNWIPGLFGLKNGIGSLARALSAKLSDLRLGTAAKRVVLEGGRVKGVETADGGFLEADDVICATLAGQAAGLIPDLPPKARDILMGLRYSSCTHVILGVPCRPFGDLWAIAIPRREGYCFAGISENAVKADGYAPPGKGTVHLYTYSEHARRMLEMSDGEVLDEVTAGLRKLDPGFPEPEFCEIFRWPEAVYLAAPGDIRRVQAVKIGLREYKGLHLAGEYLGIASVEAAVNSGVKAAERLLSGDPDRGGVPAA